MKNWKTTTLGGLTILGAIIHAVVTHLNGHPIDWSVFSAEVTAGWGLLHAADALKTQK